MNHTARSVITAALTAAVAFGVAPTTASAVPKDKPAQVKTHGKAAQAKKADVTQKKAATAEKRAAAAARKAAAQQRVVTRDIDSRIALLDRITADERLAVLDQKVIDAVHGNVAIDKAALEGIRAAVGTDNRPAREVRAEVRTYRVETYNVVLGIAHDAATVVETVAANELALDGLALSEELTAAQAANTAADVAAGTAVAEALGLTAESPVTDRAAAEASLDAAWALLDEVAAFLEGYVAPEPAPEGAPLEGDPATDEPVL